MKRKIKTYLAIFIALMLALTSCLAAAEGSAGTPPEKPSGEMGTPPEKPDGMEPPSGGPGGMGTPPDRPDGMEPPSGMPGGMGNPPEKPDGMEPPSGGPGRQNFSFEYASASKISDSAEVSGEAYSSETADENALLIDTNGSVSLSDISVTKTGSSDGGDNCSFYGLNAAVLAMGGADVKIEGGTIVSDADGANGVFSYGGNGGRNGADGDGTRVSVSGTVITTTGDGSGGIMTTGGGITEAYDLTVTTSGRSSAAIRTDRGGGTVYVKGGEYTTSGLGSPAIYSTADVTCENAVLVSNLSEGVCIEGKNSVTLVNCALTAENTRMQSNACFLDTIMIYQSMSGDSDTGTSFFNMTGGSLTSLSGHMFHVTNTSAVISLSGVTLTNEGSDVLISVCSDGWKGAGNTAVMNANSQLLEGAALVGSDSSFTLNLSNGSAFTGCVDGRITNAKGETVSESAGSVSVTIDETSVWTLTADSYISELNADASRIDLNGHSLYVNGELYKG